MLTNNKLVIRIFYFRGNYIVKEYNIISVLILLNMGYINLVIGVCLKMYHRILLYYFNAQSICIYFQI